MYAGGMTEKALAFSLLKRKLDLGMQITGINLEADGLKGL